MKQCPRCGSIYSDDSLNYCLTDGTALTPAADGDEIPTIVRDQRAAPETRLVRIEPGISPVVKYLAAALVGLILLLGVAGFVIWSLWSAHNPVTSTSNLGVPSPTRTLPTPDIAAVKDTTAEPTPSATKTVQKTPTSTLEPDHPVKDTGTARIVFQRGSTSENVRGIVAEKRSFVLRTIQGQQLTAWVHSRNNCVNFESGGSFLNLTTPSGDVGLTINNECDRPTPFTLSVTVK